MLMQEAWWLQRGWFAIRFPESTGDDAVEFVICEDGNSNWVKSKDGSNFQVPLNQGGKIIQIVFHVATPFNRIKDNVSTPQWC